MEEPIAIPFDFAAHEQAAISGYLRVKPFYDDLSSVIARVLEECLRKRRIKVHDVQHRTKEVSSFGRKAATPSEADPNSPKYPDPLKQITDLAGVRIITHFPGTLADIDQLLSHEFTIVERSDKGKELIEKERFGYQSVHYLVQISAERTRLAEYEGFSNAVAEVQVRTILQHTWAEIEHDIQYKSSTAIPSEIRRRFMALAGMLEIADREFQAIQDADKELENHAKDMVERGDLSGVEITPNALKLFLDKRIGSDGRISDWTYDWLARLLTSLGFRDLKQVESAIAPYNDVELSAIAMSGRQGQSTRFELMLLAALGEDFIERHVLRDRGWFVKQQKGYLQKFQERGIKILGFHPESSPVPSSIS